MECTTDSKKYMKRIVEDRVYMFLAGLDHNLDQVSSRVLATSPLPSLEEAYSLVCREVQRQVTIGTEDRSEASALVVHKGNFWPAPLTGPHTRHCTHYNSITHMIDTCWKKHGYLEWYKFKQAERKSNRKPPQVALTEASPSSASHVSRVSHEEGEGESLYASDPVEAESSESERPARLFEKCYTKQNKCVTLDSSTPLDDTTMPSDDSSVIDHVVQTPTELYISSPITPTSYDILDSNPTDLENTMGRRYPHRDRKEPDRLGFSKSSSNVVYPI
ncbi:hypothetical protein LWI29_023358 [Acer saccharum]|uniref:Uncharacterized protein n=1 Tax=Acer saccharum TaxID=4024 RepID=A0AA39S4G9_ACESA|nr:hypothetical protein LWI29_023358 [Acer saccharum]